MLGGGRAYDLGPSGNGGGPAGRGRLDLEVGRRLGSLCDWGFLSGSLVRFSRQLFSGTQYSANRLLDGGDPLLVAVADRREGAAVVDDWYGRVPAHVLDELPCSGQFMAQIARGLCPVSLDAWLALPRLSGLGPARNPLGEGR